MGFFSWVTSDTGRSISNRFSKRGAFPVYLLQPDGPPILETAYDGYGEFGGTDAHALLAKWNVPERCTGNVEEDRIVGIYLDDEEVRFPLKFVEDSSLGYHRVAASENCPYQGFFYPPSFEEGDAWDDDDEW